MSSSILNAALKLGYVKAAPITGHPFEVWLSRVKGTNLEGFAFMYDPATVSGWPIDEITIWVAIAPSPPLAGWPEGCGEMGAHYVSLQASRTRRTAWEDAAIEMGYKIIRDAFLPERAAAIRAGLGVHGLNGLMIAPDYGSFIDISILLVKTAPPQNARGPEYDLSPGCNKCRNCICACPKGAISENGVDTQICLRSYMSKPDQLPKEDYPKMGRRIIGCDTCQHVCPSNTAVKQVQPSEDLANRLKLETLLTNPDVCPILGKWNKPAYFKSQAVLAAVNTGRKDLLPLIEALVDDEDAILSERAKWAADQLQ